jgi:hypothetical protein
MSRYILLFLVVVTSEVMGQFKNLELDEAGGDNQVYAPSVAVNKKDPRNIVITSYPDNIYYTIDGGLGWKKTKLTSKTGVSGHSLITTDDKDNFFIVHRSTISGTERLVIQESGDRGETWGDDEMLDDDDDTMTKDQRWPAVNPDSKGSLHATWTQTDVFGSADAECKSIIYYSQSSKGKKWSTPKQISQTTGVCKEDDMMVSGASCGVSIDGKVYAAWAAAEKIYFDRSFNGGDMWLSTDLEIAKQPGGWKYNIPGHSRANGMPQLLVDYSKGQLSGAVIVVWADQRNGETDTDVWFTRSHNGGDNWTQPLAIGNDDSKRHQYFPQVAIDQTTGYIYVVYYDRRAYEDLRTDVYLAFSKDGGSSFENVKISESPFVPQEDKTFGDYISITAHKGVIVPVWTRMDNGKTSIWTSVIAQKDLIKPVAQKKK